MGPCLGPACCDGVFKLSNSRWTTTLTCGAREEREVRENGGEEMDPYFGVFLVHVFGQCAHEDHYGLPQRVCLLCISSIRQAVLKVAHQLTRELL